MAIGTNGIPTGRFGIKEVADVKFFNIDSNVTNVAEALATYMNGNPVIAFDTLKVSNIESTAENSEARGGKGNAALISWDYGREITVTLEDALLSMETLSLLFEDNATAGNEVIIDANKFPGTYAVIGTTYARDESTGKDSLFYFVIPKAKIQSETTLTMEAEGDPTVIGMTLKVLRTKSGEMMGLKKLEDYVDEEKYTLTFYYKDGKVVTKSVDKETEWTTAKEQGNWKDYPASGAVDKHAAFVEA